MNQQICEWFESGHIADAILGAPPFFLGEVTYRESHDRVLVLDQLVLWAKDERRRREAVAGLRASLEATLLDDDSWAAYDIVWSYLLVADDRGFGLPIDFVELAGFLDELGSQHPGIADDDAVAAIRERVRERLGAVT